MLNPVSQRDVVLRWIEHLGLVVARLLRGPGEADLALAAEQVRAAIAQILGPLHETVPKLDAASAAGLLHGYARLLGLQAAIEQAGDDATFTSTRARAAAMAREAVSRASGAPPEWGAWLEELEGNGTGE
jgi:hypothetical protein